MSGAVAIETIVDPYEHAAAKRGHRFFFLVREKGGSSAPSEPPLATCLLLQVCLPPCWLVLVKTAGRASEPGRQDCGRREASLRPPSSLSCDGRLIVGGVALGFGGAELSSVGNCSPTCVFGTSLLGSAFLDLAVIVSWLSTSGILRGCGLPWPWHLVVVVVLLAMFRFAFVVRSSRLRATQVSPVVVGGWPTRRASSLSFSVVRPSPSSFRGSLRLGELGMTVLCRVEYSCRVVAGLVILRRSGHSSAPFLV